MTNYLPPAPLRKILWIEDGARYELREILGTVYFSGMCLLTLAEDASTATDWLTSGRFDAVIVDVRLPPGNHPAWQNLYKQSGRDKITAQLGLRILEWLCEDEGKLRKTILGAPQGISPERIGVFTIESYADIRSRLDELRVTEFVQKTTTTPDTVILDMINRLLPPS